MKSRHLKAEDFTRQPWKNGGGFTTELARAPLWRLSIAEVERAGPFSDFTGFERTIMLLSGDGMELDFDHAPSVRIDRPEEPLVFDGGWKTHCRLLGGPVTDMNLMVVRESARATLRVLHLPPEPTMLFAAPTALYYVLRGKAAFGILGLDEMVTRGELLRIDEAGGFPIPANAAEAGTVIVEIGITHR
jgi:environmental stress-induced protein Ves